MKSPLGSSIVFIFAENQGKADKAVAKYCEKTHLINEGRHHEACEVRGGLALSDSWCSHEYFSD